MKLTLGANFINISRAAFELKILEAFFVQVRQRSKKQLDKLQLKLCSEIKVLNKIGVFFCQYFCICTYFKEGFCHILKL
jgi:hypothetical protein